MKELVQNVVSSVQREKTKAYAGNNPATPKLKTRIACFVRFHAMTETTYWKALLKCPCFRAEIGVSAKINVHEFMDKINRDRQFRLTVTIAVLGRFMKNKPCLKQASEGGLNAGVQLFF